MKPDREFLVCISSFIAAGAVFASIPDQYQTIVDRNAFGLNPPPPPSAETNAAAPPVDVKLTGFSTFGTQKKAYLVIPAKDAKESPRYLSLAAGEIDGRIELLAISETEGEVRLRNAGVEATLSLKNNGLKPTQVPIVSAAQPAGSVVYSASLPAVSSPVAAPVFNSPASSTPVPSPSTISSPVSSSPPQFQGGGIPIMPRPPVALPPPAMSSGPAFVANTAVPALAPVPSPVVFHANLNPPKQVSNNNMIADVDPVKQRLMMELQQVDARNRNIPLPPLPPMPQ